MRVVFFIFFGMLLLTRSYGQQCTISTTKTDVICNGAATGSASVSVSGGSTNNCVSPQTPDASNNCTSNCGTTITNNTNVSVNAGQKVCITTNNYNGQILLNGGTAVICGTGTTPTVIFNGGTLVINGSATLSSIAYWSSGSNIITNFGTLTLNANTTLEVGFNNHGTTSVNGGLTMGFNSSGFTNTGQLNITSGNIIFQNNGTAVNNNAISITSGTMLLDWNKSFTNNCTVTVGSGFTNRGTCINSGTFNAGSMLLEGGVFTNNSTITVSGTSNIPGGTLNTSAGSKFNTHNIVLAIAVNGTGVSCSSIKVTNSSTFNWGAAINGQARLCDLNGVIESNAPNLTTNISLTTCTCSNTPVCSYVWKNSSNVTVGTTATVNNLSAGTYTVSSTCSGCSNSPLTSSVTITEPLPLSVVVSKNDVSCFGGNTGSINLNVSGAGGPFTYSWSNGLTTQNISNLIAGTYTVTITNAQNCSTTRTVTIGQSGSILTLSSSKTDASCSGSNDGQITLTVSGGTAPYTYNWSNGATTQSISNLSAGTYSATVTDASGCAALVSIEIEMSVPVVPSVTISQNPSSNACIGFPLTLTANSSNLGTTNNFDWFINNEMQTSHQSPFISNSLTDGDIVKVTVTSNAACLTTNTFTSPEVVLQIQMNKEVPVLLISSSPDLPVSNGTSVIFSLNYSHAGSNPVIAWYKNGAIQAGATSNSFTTTVQSNDVVYYSLTPDPNQCVEVGTKISPSVVNINSINYAGLEDNLNATVYSTIKGKLYFLYFEKYQAGSLHYKIIDKTNQAVITDITLPKTKTASDNYCEIDLFASALTEGDIYVLEVKNDKNKKSYLRFKFKR